jgi:hypothetical protein
MANKWWILVIVSLNKKIVKHLDRLELNILHGKNCLCDKKLSEFVRIKLQP